MRALYTRVTLRSLLDSRRIEGGAAILAVTSLVASAFGLLRDRAFSQMFPLHEDPIGVASVYISAFRPSDLLFQVSVMSCMSVVFVPYLAGYRAKGDLTAMSSITSAALLWFTGLFVALGLVLATLMPIIAPYLVQFQGEALRLYILTARIAVLTNTLFVIGNALGQYLIASQKYWVYGITPIIWSAGTIAGTYFLTPLIGPIGPIAGTVIGTVLYVVLRAIGAMRAGYRPTIAADGIRKDILGMGLLIIPRMIALGALQIQVLFIDRIASGLGPSMVAVNQYASNVESVVPGIVGIAIAQASFALLSSSAALGDGSLLRSHALRAISLNLLLAVPGAVALFLLAPIAVTFFSIEGALRQLFVSSLMIYAVAVPFESTNHILLRTCYARKNTALPATTTAIAALAAIILASTLAPTIGVTALALAYVVGQGTQTCLLSGALGLRGFRLPSGA